MSEDQEKQNNGDQEIGSSNVEIEKNEVLPIKSEDSFHGSTEPVPSSDTKEDPDSTGNDGGSTRANFDIKSMGSGSQVAQHMSNQIDTVNNITIEGLGGISFYIKKFSIKETIRITGDLLEETEHTFVYPEDKITQLLSALILNRILLLTGQPGSGKYFTAKYLSNRLLKKDAKNYDIRLVKPQAKEFIVNFFELIDNPKLLKNKILIFKDIFLKENRDLLEFFTSYAKEQTKLFSKKLKELNAYMLFTADIDNTFDEYKMSNLDIRRDISPIDVKLLEVGFYKKLSHFCSLHKIELDKATDLFEGRINEILQKIPHMWKISLFIETYLRKILAESKEIEDAIEEVNNIEKRVEHWFLKDLGENMEEFEAWTFALCLTLLNGASYVDFERIHKAITEKLLRAIFPYKLAIKFSFTLSESNLLAKCYAQITKDSSYYVDIIEFCDHRYQEILLNSLLKNNRRMLTSIIPYLQEYVENPYHWSLRRLAGYSLGRIGELDVDSITLFYIKKWQYLKEDFYKANVGYLFEGIINSEDKNYSKFCLGYLRNMGLNNDIRVRWTAISAYKQIGLHNLELAMKELRKIQKKTIEQMLKSENMLDIFYQKGVSEDKILEDLDVLYKKTGYLWANIRYSVIALCFMVGPIKVLSELRKWIEKGNRNTKITIVLFFLGDNGILHEFENQKIISLAEDDEDSLSSNILLNSFTVGDDEIKEIVLFLKDLFEKCFPKFRRSDQKDVGYKELKLILFKHLEKWVVNTLSKSKVNQALKKLLVELYNSGGKDFRRTLYESMKRWKIPEKKDKKEEKEKEEKEKEEKKKAQLREFIDDVTNQIFDINQLHIN